LPLIVLPYFSQVKKIGVCLWLVHVYFTESEKQYPSARGFVKQLMPLSKKSFYLMHKWLASFTTAVTIIIRFLPSPD
jgi:hypothetical protein